MTKEIADIINAYHTATREGRSTALATVVHVEGSSYRMPGARMLVEDNGHITGAISGGCLEGDALRKALQAIQQGQNKLVTYDTLQEDDMEFGVQLGCNGIVHILFEPIHPLQADNPIAVLEQFCDRRNTTVLVTLFSLRRGFSSQPGTCLFLNEQMSASTLPDLPFISSMLSDAAEVLAEQKSVLKHYDTYGLSAFFELLEPPVSLVIVGAGNDAIPLMNMAAILGWRITVIDGRASHATIKRFPAATKLIVAKPEDALKKVQADEWTVFVLMTHNYNYDLAVLRSLQQIKCRYIGSLGPRKKLERMLDELWEEGMAVAQEQTTTIYGPTGLDIGAETPEEIALSILAEIKSIMAGRTGQSLRLKQGEIHTRPEQRSTSDSEMIKTKR